MKNNSKLAPVIVALVLFFLSAGVSYLVFRTIGQRRTPVSSTTDTTTPALSKPTRGSKIDPSLPKTEACPLNGQLFTQKEADIWSARRPLAVMIENHEDSRPTSGLGSADIVYEAVAEGGITRFMGIFYCGVAGDNITIAPVRSARIYFVKLVPEYDALYNHVGGAGNCDDPTVNEKAKALCFIRRNNIKDLDQFGRAGDFRTCHRLTNRLDHDVAYEHTMACFSDALYTAAGKYNWTNVDAKGVAWDKNFKSWKFIDGAASSAPTASAISFDFWSSQTGYSVVWKYTAASNTYLRENSGQPAIDLNYDDQLSAKNVIVQFVAESGPLDEHKHMDYGVTGTGKGLLFQNGEVVKITWSKATPAARTKFMDEKGKEISFVRGQIWIELVPAGNPVEYN
jgi:hypothetical protein